MDSLSALRKEEQAGLRFPPCRSPALFLPFPSALTLKPVNRIGLRWYHASAVKTGRERPPERGRRRGNCIPAISQA